ncbi:unnamed protein product [Chironomus riparius]|uniref:Uncharacterized protein n=1 Tax=Chironomus riparius TaxID=315576 RepID=A0A9P0NQH7_9DIPT|nr:unnamed protein product [Chironomus riparius]
MKILSVIITIATILTSGVLSGGPADCAIAYEAAFSLSQLLQEEYAMLITNSANQPIQDQIMLIGAEAEALLEHPDITEQDVAGLTILNDKTAHTAICLINFYSQ